MRFWTRWVAVTVFLLPGCGEQPRKSLPVTVIPRAYAIVSPEWGDREVPVCDLDLINPAKDDFWVKVEITRPSQGVIFRKPLSIPGNGRLTLTGHIQSRSLEALLKSGHILPGDSVELSHDEFTPIVVPIPGKEELDIRYKSLAGSLKEEAAK